MKKKSRTLAEAIEYYEKIIENGEDAFLDEKELQNPAYRWEKYIYALGNGDFTRGFEKYSEIIEAEHKKRRKNNPDLALYEDMRNSDNPVYRALIHFFEKGGPALPEEEGRVLSNQLLNEEIAKSANQLPVVQDGDTTTILPERIKALNKLAVLYVNYNQNQRDSKFDDMSWFLTEYAEKVGLPFVSVDKFKKYLPKAYKADIIDKDPKTGHFIPKIGNLKRTRSNR